MKSVLVAVALTAVILASRPADACSPAQTCGDSFCYSPVDAVMRIKLISGENIDTYNARVSVEIEDAGNSGLELGRTYALLTNASMFYPDEYGQSYLVYAELVQGELTITYKVYDAYGRVDECFGPDASAATIAQVVMSPSCYETLVPEPPPSPSCPTFIGCSASNGPTSALVALLLATFVLCHRRVRRALPRAVRVRR